MKFLCSLVLAAVLCAPLAQAEDEPLPSPNIPSEKRVKPTDASQPWYRDAGEYLAARSVRMGIPTDANTKVITDGKRFDVSLGKRISLYHWGEQSMAETWSVGVDGGMLASLTRYHKNGQLTFATNTFDGFFGAYVGYMADGWLMLGRYGHLSGHMVDSNPDFLSPNLYSQFWGEFILGKTFPNPLVESDWELHLQSSLGFNNTSAPRAKQPRATFTAVGSYSPGGPNKIAIIASADASNPGVQGQKPTYVFFLGAGSLNRPNTTHRPYRFGVAHYAGSDYRNQYFNKRQKWTTFEISTEF
jgi:hypothetical protein